MDLDKIREARYRRPFQPFTLRLKDGREIVVDDDHAIGIHPIELVVIDADGSVVFVDPAMVEAILTPAKVP